jgi:hypothetical protein
LPKQEDEFQAALRKAKLRPLCPFCGGPNVYPIRGRKYLFFTGTVAWSCANERCPMYRRQFPAPSRGSVRGRLRR